MSFGKFIGLLIVLLTAPLLPVNAQGWFNFKQMQQPSTDIRGSARLDPSAVVTGQPAGFLIELDVPKDVGIERLRVDGIPDASPGKIEYGTEFENLADGAAAGKERILKRFRLPVRFLVSYTNRLSLTIGGLSVKRQRTGSMNFTSQSSFVKKLPPFDVVVNPLPSVGKPIHFSGAVGRSFRLTQTIAPMRVRPGDLLTATYALQFDGYCPSNIFPSIDRLSKEFKAYEPKEILRTPNAVTWTQILVPRTTTATDTALVSVNYYNLMTKRYEVARATPIKLDFISDKAATKENTAVRIDTASTGNGVSSSENRSDAETGKEEAKEIILRFAPSEKSPVIAVLPADTPFLKRGEFRGWQRISAEQATGWIRPTSQNQPLSK